MTGEDHVFCFAVDRPNREGIPTPHHIVVVLAENVEEAYAKVMTKYGIEDRALVCVMHLHDVLGDFYDCVAELS